MARALSAVDMEDFAGDKRGSLEIKRAVHDVGDGAYPVLGMHSGISDGGIDCGVQGRIDDTRRYRVDPDSVAGVLDGERSGDGGEATFVSAVNADGTAV